MYRLFYCCFLYSYAGRVNIIFTFVTTVTLSFMRYEKA